MTTVKKGIGGSECSRCHAPVGAQHALGCAEAAMQEAASRRPHNFNQLSGEDQWAIDKALGCLDWEGH